LSDNDLSTKLMILSAIKDRILGKVPWFKRRSSRWRTIRKQHLIKFPLCEVCGESKKTEVHHIIPFHVAPELELVEDNLISLCEQKKFGINCHLFVGHLGRWRGFNPKVREDIKEIKTMFLREWS